MSTTRQDESPQESAVYTVRMDRPMMNRLREIAALEDRSLAGKLRQMVKSEIAAFDGEEPA